MKNKLKIGFVGLGQRGNGLMTNVLVNDEVVITALCDITRIAWTKPPPALPKTATPNRSKPPITRLSWIAEWTSLSFPPAGAITFSSRFTLWKRALRSLWKWAELTA
ncbi:MAG: hypothetical protein ACLUSP_07135 [Christensenellales bacterium]